MLELLNQSAILTKRSNFPLTQDDGFTYTDKKKTRSKNSKVEDRARLASQD